MYEWHTTKDGNQMMIAQMKDSHLINTIKLFCNKMTNTTKIVNSNFSFFGQVALTAIKPNLSSENFKEKAERHIHNALPPYIMEASLRGLDISGLLQEGYGRSAQITTSSNFILKSRV